MENSMKFCRGCQRSLPESDFSRNNRSSDALDWRCRRCKAQQQQQYIHSDKGRITRQAYYAANKGSHTDRKRQRRKQYSEENPEKVRARWLLGNAVRRGYIDKPTNDRHWYNNWEFHHPDHSKPYYGVWVSPSDNRLIDLGKKLCPPCTDYTERVREKLLSDWGLL